MGEKIMSKIRIKIFPKYGPCCGETTCGCADDPQLESFLKLVRASLGKNAKIELYDYSSEEKLSQAIAQLTLHLSELELKDRQVDVLDILRYATPAVVVNENLLSQRSFPDGDKLRNIVNLKS